MMDMARSQAEVSKSTKEQLESARST